MTENDVYKLLLAPVSIIYTAITSVRNFLYDHKILLSNTFDIPLICIGNMSVGGDGKTPHTEYLIQLLAHKITVATLSRGYKRTTKGYKIANWNNNETAETLGDEPYLYFAKYGQYIAVAVGENRVNAVINIAGQVPNVGVILLDDAFQHRSIHCGLNILVTDFANPFYADFPLPSGRLREWRSGYKRADIIIVSKCPANLSEQNAEEIRQRIQPTQSQGVYFTTFQYLDLYSLKNSAERVKPEHIKQALFVSGIAKPSLAIEYLTSKNVLVETLLFDDHHAFSIDDVQKMLSRLPNELTADKYIITTEKDATRLLPFADFFVQNSINVFVLPIQVSFLFDKQEEFNFLIKKYVGLPLFS